MSFESIPKNESELAVLTRGARPDFFKLQVDAFPTPAFDERGSVLENTDTGDRYIWTGTTWIQTHVRGLLINEPRDQYLEIGTGRDPLRTPELVVGITPPVPMAIESFVWDHADILPLRSDIPAAADLFISSTNAADTTQTVSVFALDSSFDSIILSATLNGQNQVQLINIDTSGNDEVIWVQAARAFVSTPLGDVFVALTSATPGGIPSTTAAIQGKIIQGNNITRMAAYTVPNGMSAVFMAIRGNTDDDSKVATIVPQVTTFGDPPLRANGYSVTTNTPPIVLNMPFGVVPVLGFGAAAFPAKTKIQYLTTPSSNNTIVHQDFEMIIVNEALIGV